MISFRMTIVSLWVFASFVLAVLGSNVVILDSKNFEHLTQASTGATTGDWLIEFYAPWCGHCKKLTPTYEQVADSLLNEVNVAKVDVMANRQLGTRFDIKGFPTIKFLRQGKVYTFKGRRSFEELTEFARGGYQIHEADDVPGELGMLGEITHVYRHAYKQAGKDILAGNYFTMSVILTFLPIVLGLLLLLIIVLPKPGPAIPPGYQRRSAASQQQRRATSPRASASIREGEEGEEEEQDDEDLDAEGDSAEEDDDAVDDYGVDAAPPTAKSDRATKYGKSE